MTFNVGQIKNAQVLIQPSQKLRDYIRDIKILPEDTPAGIENIVFKNKLKDKPLKKQPKPEYLLTEQDKKFISALKLKELSNGDVAKKSFSNSLQSSGLLLTLQDLHWLYLYIQMKNKDSDKKVYLHDLMENSEVILPKNEEIPRNEELEKRCQKLKAEQQNKEYHNMTKNVDSFRRKLPEDTLGYQLKMMNSHLIAVFQFILSIITGFVFGFVGIELLIGSLDFGFRLMLGIACALVIAVAELYFLAKKLNEDLEFENIAKKPVTSEQK